MSTVLHAIGAIALGCLGLLASARAEEPEPPRPDVHQMTLDQLLAEFSTPSKTESIPHSQRWVDVVNALRKQGEPLNQRVRENLQSTDEKVRLQAVYLLGWLGKGAIPMVPELLKAAADPSDHVRRAALSILGRLRDPRAFYTLIEATRDPSPWIRSTLLEAGPSLADGQFAIAVLALSDPDRGVRVQAARTLKTLRDPRAVPHLIPLLDDTETNSFHVDADGTRIGMRPCYEAAMALDAIVKSQFAVIPKGTEEDNMRKVNEWKQWWKDNSEQFLQHLYAEPDMVRSRE